MGELINKKVELNQKPTMKIILQSHLILRIKHQEISLPFHLIHYARHQEIYIPIHLISIQTPWNFLFLSSYSQCQTHGDFLSIPSNSPFQMLGNFPSIQLILHTNFFDFSLFKFFRLGFFSEELITFESFNWFESLINVS